LDIKPRQVVFERTLPSSEYIGSLTSQHPSDETPAMSGGSYDVLYGDARLSLFEDCRVGILTPYASMQADLNAHPTENRKPVGIVITRLIEDADGIAQQINQLSGRDVAVSHHSKNKADTSYRQILVTALPVRRRRLWGDGQSVWR
jgi:hypothetical protein